MAPLPINRPFFGEGYSPVIERTMQKPLEQLAAGVKDLVKVIPLTEAEIKLKAIERLQAWGIARDDVVAAQMRDNELHGTNIDPTTTDAYLLADSFYQAADKELWALQGLNGPDNKLGNGLIEELWYNV